LPGARREENRGKSLASGIAVAPDLLDQIRALAGDDSHA
jgi:LDH2 family malate/lactate/ureidoglycolate dehydrogenase